MAFDANVLGVRPDFSIAVRRDVPDEIDKPMLEHGLKAVDRGCRVEPEGRRCDVCGIWYCFPAAEAAW